MKKQLLIFLMAPVCGLAQPTPDPFMGDWQGRLAVNGVAQEVAVYLIPRGEGHYEAKVVRAFNERCPVLHHLRGEVADGRLKLLDALPLDPAHVLRVTDDGVVVDAAFWIGDLARKAVHGTVAGRWEGSFVLRQIERRSPTLGKQPPAGARVLMGKQGGLSAWQPVGKPNQPAPWKALGNGVFEVHGGDIVTKEKFRDCELHVEFRLPYMPHATGQGRANSGVYLQGRYEVQVLDSYGLSGEDNECGGIYHVAKPLVNMCLPPLQWQTYDITFRAPRFKDGRKVANARITVVHNGVVIQDDTELPGPTAGATDQNEAAPGGLRLQDHGNPVQYRNIWLLPR